MSYQSIIDQHAAAMTARHEAIDNAIQEQAATRANEINDKIESISSSLEQTGTALGSVAGAYRLGRGVFRKYKQRGIKAAAQELAEKVKASKGKLQDIKDDDDDAGAGGEGGTGGTGGAGGAGGAGEAGDEAGDLARATSQSIRDQFTRLTQAPQPATGSEPAAPTGTGTDDPTEVANRLDNLTGTSADAEPTEINLADEPTETSLNFKLGTVAEPEDLQVARYTQMAQDVFNRNRAKGLDIEGNPLTDNLKPAERVLADVTKKPTPQGGADETNDPAVENSAPEPVQAQPDAASSAQQAPQVSDAEAAVKDPAASRFLDNSSGQAAGDTPATQSAPTSDAPSADSQAAGGIQETNLDDELARTGAKNMVNNVSSGAKTGLQQTGTELEEGLQQTGSKVGGLLGDAGDGLLSTLGEGLAFLGPVGEIASVGLGIAGLIESLVGGKTSESDQASKIPVAPTASGIDPTAIGQVAKENIS